MTEKLETVLAEAASHEEIEAALHNEQNQKAREPRATVEPETEEPGTFTRTETIGGRTFEFEADSELELANMIANAYRVAYNVQPEPVTAEEPKEVVDPAKAAVEQAQLEIQFRNGQISAKDYLEKSGAVSEYLERQGVPVEELKSTVEKNREREVIQSWADATQEFLSSPAGADWPGGERNKEMVGLMLARLGLVDAEDKVAALAQAYGAMKSHNLIFADSPEASESSQAAHRTQDAPVQHQQTAQTQHVTRQQPTRQSQQRNSSSLFGQSSGTSGNDLRDTSRDRPQFAVSSSASPAEILEAWKREVIAKGGDPNAEFQQVFSGRR